MMMKENIKKENYMALSNQIQTMDGFRPHIMKTLIEESKYELEEESEMQYKEIEHYENRKISHGYMWFIMKYTGKAKKHNKEGV
jgi:hypothetical protein